MCIRDRDSFMQGVYGGGAGGGGAEDVAQPTSLEGILPEVPSEVPEVPSEVPGGYEEPMDQGGDLSPADPLETVSGDQVRSLLLCGTAIACGAMACA
eukprot:2462602-Rhodomonas_salina.1